MPDLTPEEITAIQDRIKQDIDASEERHKAEIAAQKELLRAYDLVRQHQASSNGQTPSTAPAITARHRSRIYAPQGYGYNKKVVQQAINLLARGDTFTIKRIHNILAEYGIDLSIEAVTTVFNRLREGDPPFITVTSQGKGRRATAFRKT